MKKNTKSKNILIFVFIFIVVFSMIIGNQSSNLDELWNYNTARAITMGLVPYKDISMITTPVLPMLMAVFLKCIANELIISRILAAFLWTGILFITYKIFGKLLKESNISLIFTALIGYLCRNIYCIDYNVTIVFITIIILYEELKNLKNVMEYNKKLDIFLRNISWYRNMCKTKYRIYFGISFYYV